MKILIVDDNTDDRLFMKYNMENHGCEVIEAADGEEGLDMAAVHRPDVIISDALMPKMDGFQFLRKIKQDEHLKTIPFIFYSAVYTGYREDGLAKSLGADAFIVKPKEPQEFWNEITKALNEHVLEKKDVMPVQLIEDEEEFLRKYSHIVATRLEAKTRELEKAMAELSATRERLQHLLSYSPTPLYSLETSEPYAVTFISENITALLGYTAQEFMKEPDFRHSHIHPDDFSRIRKELGLLFERGHHVSEYRFMHKDGSYRWLHDEAKLVKDGSGNPLEIVGSLVDITERKRLEEQLRHAQKMEAIGTLAGGIAHDFNNMLNVIIGYAGLMQMAMKPADPQLHYLREILTAGERATHLTKGLLAFSRKQIIELKPENINSIVDGVKKMLTRIIGEDIELRTTISENDLTVTADRMQIEQVLMNLAANARDAMPDGGILSMETQAVEMDGEYIEAHGYGEPGRYALISISDTGAGMDEKTRERIFEPYFTTKEVGKGTGLGLSIVYGIVKQHKGYINCYSEPDKGTTFKIYLPLIKAEARVSKAAGAAPPKGGTETILIAEDDPSVRALTKALLEKSGYSVIEAVDGEDAVNKFRENKDRIQLLVFDVIMPKKNGKEAYVEIKAINPHIRTLFVSGYAADIMHRKGVLEEGLDFIIKPLSPNTLLGKVRELLDKKPEP